MKYVRWTRWSCVGLIAGGALIVRAADIESVEKAATEWARIRSETVRLENDWQWQRQLLMSTNTALQDRVRQLQVRRDELKAKTTGDRTDLQELATKNKAADDAIASANAHLKTVAEKLIQLRATLPPRLSQALELPYRSLANPALSPGERMLYVTTILNRCAQFNKTITYSDEPVSLPGQAEQKLLNVIYWGLGQGYALDRVTGKAYIGAPHANGWAWQENDAAAGALQQVIAINQEKADPDFVVLPAQLAHPATAK